MDTAKHYLAAGCPSDPETHKIRVQPSFLLACSQAQLAGTCSKSLRGICRAASYYWLAGGVLYFEPLCRPIGMLVLFAN